MRHVDTIRHILLATVERDGTPRLTPVEECTQAGEGRVTIRAWIDIPPLETRAGRSHVALLLWDERGHGYQLIGHTLRATDTAVLDGLSAVEEQAHFPQVERDILMEVEAVEDFHLVELPLSRP